MNLYGHWLQYPYGHSFVSAVFYSSRVIKHLHYLDRKNQGLRTFDAPIIFTNSLKQTEALTIPDLETGLEKVYNNDTPDFSTSIKNLEIKKVD
jgi:hypothetical protein